MEKINRRSKNKREKTIALVYVSLIFFVVTFAACWSLFYYTDNKAETRKEFVIAKMDRIREFQSVQNEQIVIVDSMYNKIREFDPKISASYEENDIKYYLTDIKRLYEDNNVDGRYKIFYQTSNFYNMWFADRKELWSKQQNMTQFKIKLEECQIGLDKKKNELKTVKKEL